MVSTPGTYSRKKHAQGGNNGANSMEKSPKSYNINKTLKRLRTLNNQRSSKNTRAGKDRNVSPKASVYVSGQF